jgi:RNA polymerase sigma-70 factor (ECF subfamily)
MEQLLEACRKGDRKAQKELYQRMSPVLMGICKRYLKKKEDAEEALGNAFLKIYSTLSQYRGSGSFEGWMKKITVRTCLDFLRAKNSPFDLGWEHEIAEEPIGQDDAEYLLFLIGQLPVGYRTVFNLYAIEGYKHQEISELLNISEGTSKSQLSKARRMLKEQILKERTITK